MFKNRIADIDIIKKEIDAFMPLSPHCASLLKEYFRIGLTYSSNALEGNTLTETETKIILEDGLTIGGKTIREHLEVIGHDQAYDFMLELAKKTEFSEQDIKEIHRLFYYRIDQKNAGEYRTVSVVVTGTDFEFPKADDVPLLMAQFIQELSHLKSTLHPVHYAAVVYLRLVTIHPFLVTIHPFVDGLSDEASAKLGNGRTARLLMNLALLQAGYVITIIPPIMRSAYISAVRQGNKGEEDSFMNFISEMVYESSKEYLRLLKNVCPV